MILFSIQLHSSLSSLFGLLRKQGWVGRIYFKIIGNEGYGGSCCNPKTGETEVGLLVTQGQPGQQRKPGLRRLLTVKSTCSASLRTWVRIISTDVKTESSCMCMWPVLGRQGQANPEQAKPELQGGIVFQGNQVKSYSKTPDTSLWSLHPSQRVPTYTCVHEPHIQTSNDITTTDLPSLLQDKNTSGAGLGLTGWAFAQHVFLLAISTWEYA